MKASSDIGIQTMLGPKQSDKFGDFYLVRGTDGGLYRQNTASKDLYLLVPSGDWESVPGTDINIQSNQKGVESLLGPKIMLDDRYDSSFLSEKLLEVSVNTRGIESKAQENVIEDLSRVKKDPYVSSATLTEDAMLMPESDNKSDLKNFLKDDSDILLEEMQKS
tara:strand:- start:7405 stop:7896 length:492 start_codon:yes stop_codon:yes gene_type:complete